MIIPGMYLAGLLTAVPGMGPVDMGTDFFMPPQASTMAESVDAIFYFITWVSVVFFVVIVTTMCFFAWKYRRRNPEDKALSSVTHNLPIELTWTIIPLLLSIWMFFIGVDGYMDQIRAPVGAYEVDVLAQRWNWSFEHRNGAQDSRILKIPVGRPVKLVMRSSDVLHAVFIPSFRVKQDIIPGRYSYLWFEAKEPGTYQLLCAEYCGTQHSQMTAIVVAYEPEEFERIITEDARWLDEFADEDLYRAGLRIYARCASCHSLDGSRMTGPSFRDTHDKWKAGTARVLDSGVEVTIDENYVRNSILNPASQIVFSFLNQMPANFAGQLEEREVHAMIQFIKRLDEVVDENGDPLPKN